MRAHVDWPEPKEKAPVWIDPAGGVDKILEQGYLSAKLKMPGLKALGVVLDAADNPQADSRVFAVGAPGFSLGCLNGFRRLA